jgi:hypothetical protein
LSDLAKKGRRPLPCLKYLGTRLRIAKYIINVAIHIMELRLDTPHPRNHSFSDLASMLLNPS